MKFNTQEVVNGQIHEHPIVQAANVALENTAKTLTWMLTPPLLRPLVWPIVSRIPPKPIAALNVARMQLYTAALTLARNAVGRLGSPWKDDLQITQAFGKSCTAGNPECHLLAADNQASCSHVAASATNSICLRNTGQSVQAVGKVIQTMFPSMDCVLQTVPRRGRSRSATHPWCPPKAAWSTCWSARATSRLDSCSSLTRLLHRYAFGK